MDALRTAWPWRVNQRACIVGLALHIPSLAVEEGATAVAAMVLALALALAAVALAAAAMARRMAAVGAMVRRMAVGAAAASIVGTFNQRVQAAHPQIAALVTRPAVVGPAVCLVLARALTWAGV